MTTTDHMQLKCGNPETTENLEIGNIPAAAFSRFVFPFAYHLEKSSEQSQGLFYQQNDGSSHPRRKKYLTNETALVLFERAKWFEIPTPAWQNTPWETNDAITVTLKSGDFEVKMLPPALVLFEFTEPQQTTGNNTNTLQTGFLYVDIYFPPEQSPSPSFDDLLLFNELFRYFDMPYEGHLGHGYKECLKNIPIEYSINNGCYRKLDSVDCKKNAKYFVRWLNLLKIPIKHNGKDYTLIPDADIDAAKKWIYSSERSKESCLVHVDNRCYVWTAAIINEGGCALNKAFNHPLSRKLHAHHYGHWIKLLNIDAPDDTPQQTHNDVSDFAKEWAETKTYKRWEDQGNWYGFNNHSGVMLLAAKSLERQPQLCRVFREQYFDQTILLLYLRTTLFCFSRKLSLIIHDQQRQYENNQWLEQITQLRKEFSRFAILYQFPSLSNQQQAIEMYALARECLDIDELYREVQVEIANTHDFLEQTETNKLGEAANMLAQWGVPIAATAAIASLASLVVSLFTINGYKFSNCTEDCVRISIGIPIAFSLTVVLITKRIVANKFTNKGHAQ